jgi:hypothetical protein
LCWWPILRFSVQFWFHFCYIGCKESPNPWQGSRPSSNVFWWSCKDIIWWSCWEAWTTTNNNESIKKCLQDGLKPLDVRTDIWIRLNRWQKPKKNAFGRLISLKSVRGATTYGSGQGSQHIVRDEENSWYGYLVYF